MRFSRASGRSAAILRNEKNIKPVRSVYDLSVPLNNGEELPLSRFEGKKILLVNTASDCGYTDQYDDLQKLYTQHQQDLVVIGFPANDFKEQEKGSDEEIAQFCRLNYGISFPLSKKSVVIKSPQQNEIFRWLTDKTRNGWNDKPPSWNFSKYLVNEEGVLTHYFDPAISPAEIFDLT
jgi:glutathione peroxidase